MPENPMTGRPAAPVESVFGRERDTPHAVFERSRIENAGSTPVHRPNDLALACPRCANDGIPESRMFAQVNQGYYCMRGHKWQDFDELMSLAPRKLAFKGIKARQENWQKLELEMPASTLQELQKKFANNLPETICGVLDVISQTRSMLINEECLTRLENMVGVPLKNGNNLVGAVFAIKEKERTQTETIEKLEARASSNGTKNSPGTVTIDINNVMEKLITKLGPGESVEDYLQNAITTSVVNDWW